MWLRPGHSTPISADFGGLRMDCLSHRAHLTHNTGSAYALPILIRAFARVKELEINYVKKGRYIDEKLEKTQGELGKKTGMAVRSGGVRLGEKNRKNTCFSASTWSRTNCSSKKENCLKSLCQKWDSNPRPHTWTRTLSVCRNLQKELNLESGALDRSAILTTDSRYKNRTPNVPRNVRSKKRATEFKQKGHWVFSPTPAIVLSKLEESY